MAGREQRPTDDVEGHGRHFQDTEAVDDDRGSRLPDNTEGHGWRFSQDAEAGDDTEGHAIRCRQDPEAVGEDQAGDDTQGHIRKY